MVKKMFVLIIMAFILSSCSTPDTSSDISDTPNLQVKEDLFSVLSTNLDAKEYIDAYPESEIIEIRELNSEDISKILNETQFTEVYSNLPQNRTIVEVTLNGGTQLNLLAHIDKETNEVYSAVGLFLTGMG